MTINRSIKALKKEVLTLDGDGKEVVAAVMHPLTPHDLTTILVHAGVHLDGIMQAWEKIELPEVDSTGKKVDAEAAAQMLLERAPQIIGLVAQYAPQLIAEAIAVSAREHDAAQYVQENWSLPLQFDCLKALAEVTFISPQGFMEFVGKAMALGQVGKAIVRPSAVEKQTKTSRRRMGSDAG